MIRFYILLLILFFCKPGFANDKITILSYNILANSHIKPQYYPEVSDNILKWNVRKQYLVPYILNFHADVLCLQEYEDGGLKDIFNSHGYKSIIYNEASSSHVGLAIFYRADTVKLIEEQKIKLHNSDKVAIIARFSACEKDFILINTKIKWVSEDLQKTKYDGYKQIEWLLLKNLPVHSDIVICGDFNATSDSSVYKLFIDNNFKDIFVHNAYNTIKANSKVDRIDYCFTTSTDKYQTIKIKGMEVSDIVPSPTIPSDHLPLIFSFQP